MSGSFRPTKIYLIVCAFIMIVTYPSLSAIVPSYGDWLGSLPDNAGLRQQMAATIASPLTELSSRNNRTFAQLSNPSSVRFEVIKESGYTYLAFMNRVGNTHPADGAGTVIIRRNNRDGSFGRVKIFLRQEPSLYIRVQPAPSGSVMGIYFADDRFPLYENLRIPISIQQAAISSVRQLVEMTNGRVNWQSLLDVPSSYYFRNVEAMISKIRKALPGLPDAEDGAMDESGRLVRIAGLRINQEPGFNCSGFVKWIADGLFRPLTGLWLKIDDLKARQLDMRGSSVTESFEESRDPFFGLDWTRNIAARLATARAAALGIEMRSSTPLTGELWVPGTGPESWDVRDAPYAAYIEDKGYRVSELRQVMYTLALKDPDFFYLGVINGEWGDKPVLWQYYHIVSLFPMVTEAGSFETVVLERNVETSIASLERRYPNEYIHLVRIKASLDFDPPVIQ